MPFLKPLRPTPTREIEERCKRNGWRHEIYGTRPKEWFKDHYKGQWKNDKKEGLGWEITRNGWIYEGNWLNGKKHGCGVLRKVLDNGRIRLAYRGLWENGKKQGYGNSWYSDGGYHEGEYDQGKRQGHGHIWNGDGSYYEGTWLNDRYHGVGLLIQANCDRYRGEFVNGKKEGRGVFYHLQTGQLQEGIWMNDMCVKSSIEDIPRRQCAIRPTSFPIPQLRLATRIDVLDPITYELCGDKIAGKRSQPSCPRLDSKTCGYAHGQPKSCACPA